MNYELNPKTGFPELFIGMKMDDFIAKYGAADEKELIEDEFFKSPRELHNYYELEVSPVVDTATNTVVSLLCEHPETTLNGEKVFGLTLDEFVYKFKEKLNFDVVTEEDDFDGISCFIGECQFFFDDDVTISFLLGV